MSRIREILGLDGKDLTIHVGITVVVAVIAGGAGGEFNYDGDAVAMLILASSAALLGLRIFLGRRKGLQALPAGESEQLRELDDRLYELEQERIRLHELEERVDFAERLLVTERERRGRLEDPR